MELWIEVHHSHEWAGLHAGAFSTYDYRLHVQKRGGGKRVIKCESGSFRLSTPKSRRGLIRVYLGTEYICLTSLDLHCHARKFNIIHQNLLDYILTLPDFLSYVTMFLTSVVYVEPMPNASTYINYPHLYEELVSFAWNTYLILIKTFMAVLVVLLYFVCIQCDIHETFH